MMRKLAAAFCFAALLVGCSHPQSPSTIAFRTYEELQPLRSEVVVAMIAYSAVAANKDGVERPVSAVRDYLDAIRKTGVVHANYPVKPFAGELRVVEEFVSAWARRAGNAAALAAYAQELISMISDREYNEPGTNQ